MDIQCNLVKDSPVKTLQINILRIWIKKF